MLLVLPCQPAHPPADATPDHYPAPRPRAIDVLRYHDVVFILAEKLATDVSFEELFIIRCETLDLTVWGQTLTEAEEALAFGFYSLYQNYYLEDDANLAPDAQRLKAVLHTLVLEAVQV